MKLIFDLDVEKCVGCGACSVACMDQNDFDPASGDRPFRAVSTVEKKTAAGWHCENLSLACMHCADAPCVKACPVGCIEKDEETGLTLFDNTNCIGCHSCAMACPFGAPRFNDDGKMVKCHGCYERMKAGMEPACVRVCPFDALKVYPKDEYLQAKAGKSLHRITEVILDQN